MRKLISNRRNADEFTEEEKIEIDSYFDSRCAVCLENITNKAKPE